MITRNGRTYYQIGVGEYVDTETNQVVYFEEQTNLRFDPSDVICCVVR